MKKPEKYFKKFLKELSKYKESVHSLNVGASDEEITKFEDTYNINLPHFYREWLKLYNGGVLFSSMNGTTIAGIKNKTFTNGSFEIADNFNTTKRTPDMPNYLLFLAKTAEGDLIGYDLNHTDHLDGEIIYYDIEEKTITSRWDNLAQWLEDEMIYWTELVDYEGNKLN